MLQLNIGVAGLSRALFNFAKTAVDHLKPRVLVAAFLVDPELVEGDFFDG